MAAKRYLKHFGFGFVMFVNGYCAQDVLAAMTDRLLNDIDTERKVVRNELARINRTRLDRMLGPKAATTTGKECPQASTLGRERERPLVHRN